MVTGQTHRVRLRGEGNGMLIADAVAFVPTDAAPPRATWLQTIAQEDTFEIYANWIQWSGHASNAPYTIVHQAGSTSVLANQQLLGGQWHLLGTFTFQPNEDHGKKKKRGQIYFSGGFW